MTRLAPFFCANFGAVKLAIIGITVMAVLLTLQGCSPTAADSGYFGKRIRLRDKRCDTSPVRNRSPSTRR